MLLHKLLLLSLIAFAYSGPEKEEGVRYANRCETCKILATELQERLKETGKLHDVLEMSYSPINITVHNIPITTIREGETLDSDLKVKNFFTETDQSSQQKFDIGLIENAQADPVDRSGWTTLTPQEIPMWIDRKARCCFPLSFLVFNAIFWTFVYFL